MSRWPSDARDDVVRTPIVRSDVRQRTGHRRERDRRRRRRSFRDRLDGALVDVSLHRAVAYKDLAEVQFDGHPYTARRGVNQLLKDGLVQEHTVAGPQGGKFQVLTATKAGAERARSLAAERGYAAGQQAWSGRGREKDLSHDAAIYREARIKRKELEARGVVISQRIRLDAELRRIVSRRSETARVRAGRAAADEARRRAAEELHLPVTPDGKVLYPDAQLEYELETEDGRVVSDRAKVEIVSEHYRAGAIQAKAAAGFALGATNGQAARNISRAMGRAARALGQNDRSGGRGGGRDPASVEL